jgi:hypothetical protein
MLPLCERQQCACRLRAVFPSYGGPRAAALAMPSRPLRRRSTVPRLRHPVALDACSMAPGKPMVCERRAPFLP